MTSITQYGVKFVGYGAYVLANKKGVEIDCAHLDFIAGLATLKANDGWVIAPSREELGPFVNTLPKIVGELEDLLKELSMSSGSTACRGPYVATKPPEPPFSEGVRISIAAPPGTGIYVPNVHFRQFIRKVVKRFAEIEQVLELAEKMGIAIERRPYAEYIDEIDKTGLCRVEAYGFALLIDGKLRFHPDRSTGLVRVQGREAEIQLVEGSRTATCPTRHRRSWN